jgi:phosphatidylglycerol---prolipoprotein diacylglyceryl transferase
MSLAYITWDVSPTIVKLGPLALRWYGLFFAGSFVIGYIIMLRIFKKENFPVELLDKLSIYMLISTVIGARLGHIFFYQPQEYLAHPLDILKVWEGGLASHGAAIGILIGLGIFSINTKRPFLWTVDRIVIVVALAGFMIRMGNLCNSEIYGNLTTVPWGFIFIRDISNPERFMPHHPTQIYEGLCYLLSFAILLWYYYRKDGKPRHGILFGLFLILIFGTRFFIEFIKEPQVASEVNMTLNIGQRLSIPFVLIGIFFLVWGIMNKGKTARHQP